MAIAAQTIIDRAETILQDTTNIRWPASELVQWFNDAQREIVNFKPESSVTNTVLQLAQDTKQTLPSAAIRLIDVVRNMGSGSTPGSAVRLVMREVLDAQRPDWHTEAGATTIRHYIFDARNPKNFYVYPKPSTGTVNLEVVYSVAPTDVTESGGTVSGNLALDDIYSNAVLDFILYRAYSKDAEYAQNAQRAAAHFQQFTTSVGARTATDGAVNPNANSVWNPANPMQAKAA